ncbi:MAG: Veg family protein [Firmicutes bacterium]|nr:Veg family protein [Bacillota bacterium]
MRRVKHCMATVKNSIEKLKGVLVDLEVCRGRKKINHYRGTVEDIHNSVFTIRLKNPTTVLKQSYSYSDVLCGEVKLVKVAECSV